MCLIIHQYHSVVNVANIVVENTLYFIPKICLYIVLVLACKEVILSSSPSLSHSLADRWGTTVDFTTNFLHSSRFLAFCNMMFHSRPVHSLMLSSHHFLCLPLCLPPCTVPCRIVLASQDDLVMPKLFGA